jgi:hypothetical protein
MSKKHGLKKFFHQPLGSHHGGTRTFLRHAEKHLQNNILPIALPILGSSLAGPVGSTIGGALGGAMRRHQHDAKSITKGALRGLAIGGAIQLVHGLGSAIMGGSGGPFAGFGSNLSQMGGGLMGGGLMQGAKGLLGNGRGQGMGRHGEDEGGLSKADMIDALLAGTAAIAGMKSKSEVDKKEKEEFENLGARNNPFPVSQVSPYRPTPNPNYGKNFDIDKSYYGENPFLTPQRAPIPYASGGYVHGGYIDGDEGGQDDDYDTHIPAGSYVMDATTVSALGDGNSENGKKKIQELRDTFMESGIIPHHHWNPSQHEGIHVKLSRGEDVLEPELVRHLGNGNVDEGVKKLNEARKKLRKEKGMRKFIPPKSKHLSSYLR